MVTNINSTNGHVRRGFIALAAVAAVGVSAGSVAAWVDVPDDWPPGVQQAAQQGSAYCGNPAAAAAAGYNIVIGSGLIIGTNLDDLILGSPLPDRIEALAGDDIVCASDSGDKVRAGTGNDLVFGEGGDDRLRATTATTS